MSDDVFALRLNDGMLLQHLQFRRSQNAIETAQNGERKDDFAILVPFVRPAQQVANTPDEIGHLGMSFSNHQLPSLCVRHNSRDMFGEHSLPQK